MGRKKRKSESVPSEQLESAMELEMEADEFEQVEPDPQPEYSMPESDCLAGDPGDENPPPAVVEQMKGEPKFLPMFLMILQILGAIPAVIEAAMKLWELIQKIRDMKTKKELRFQLRNTIYSTKSIVNRQRRQTMSLDENDAMSLELDKMTEKVLGILKSQGG